MDRDHLTDEQWAMVSDLFEQPKPTGRPPRDRRQVLDGILWILRTGSPWRDLPEKFGPWQTAWDLFNKWNADRTWDVIMERLRGEVDIDEELWCIDGTVIRAARCASGGGKRGIPKNQRTTPLAAAAADGAPRFT